MVNLDYLYNPDAAKPHFNKNFLLDKKLGFQVIEHGMILPHKRTPQGKWFGQGGIVDSQGQFVRTSTVFNAGEAYSPSPNDIQHSSETVVYFGMFYPVWGHCITDDLKYVWFLKSEYFNQFKNCPLVYIAWGGRTFDTFPNYKRILEILEIDAGKIREIKQPTQFDKIILPDESFTIRTANVEGFTNEFRETIERIRAFGLKNRTPTPSKKLYMFHGKKGQIGEERVAEYLENKGYYVINPEQQQMSFDEQLNLFVNCESFSSAIGSSAQNLLFLRDNTEVNLIHRGFYRFNEYQEICNQVNPLNVTYIDSSLSIFSTSTSSGPFFYLLSKQLKEFFGNKWTGYEEEDFKNFLQYVENANFRGLTIKPAVRDYYSSIFGEFIDQLKRNVENNFVYNILAIRRISDTMENTRSSYQRLRKVQPLLNEYNVPDKFRPYVTARIDIKFMSTAGEFEIFYVSDEKATVWKPKWYQDGGTAYQIQSYAGKIEIQAKAAVNGKIHLQLKGLHVRNPEDSSKLVPHWIDYTKLVVDDKILFEGRTPAWHDRPYFCELEAKAGAEIKIQIEWLPHKSDV